MASIEDRMSEKVAFLKVNDTEFIIVDTNVGLNTDEAPNAVCLCGTCHKPMDLFKNRSGDGSVIICSWCGLRLQIADGVVNFKDLKKCFKLDEARANVCGRCLGKKVVEVNVLQGVANSLSRILHFACPKCSNPAASAFS